MAALERIHVIHSSFYSMVPDLNDGFFITAPIISTEIYPAEILREAVWSVENQEVRLSHITPEDDPRSYVGRVVKVWWDEAQDLMMAKMSIYDNMTLDMYDGSDEFETLDLRERLELDAKLEIEERFFKGISVGVVKFVTKYLRDDIIDKIEIREVSLARDPACTRCSIREISEYEKEAIIVSEENTVSTPESNVRIAEYESKIVKLEAKNSELAKSIETYEARIIKATDINNELIENSKLQDTKILEVEARLVSFENERKGVAIDTLLEAKGIPANSPEHASFRQQYLTFSDEELKFFQSVETARIKVVDNGFGVDRAGEGVTFATHENKNSVSAGTNRQGVPEDPALRSTYFDDMNAKIKSGVGF